MIRCFAHFNIGLVLFIALALPIGLHLLVENGQLYTPFELKKQ